MTRARQKPRTERVLASELERGDIVYLDEVAHLSVVDVVIDEDETRVFTKGPCGGGTLGLIPCPHGAVWFVREIRK